MLKDIIIRHGLLDQKNKTKNSAACIWRGCKRNPVCVVTSCDSCANSAEMHQPCLSLGFWRKCHGIQQRKRAGRCLFLSSCSEATCEKSSQACEAHFWSRRHSEMETSDLSSRNSSELTVRRSSTQKVLLCFFCSSEFPLEHPFVLLSRLWAKPHFFNYY